MCFTVALCVHHRKLYMEPVLSSLRESWPSQIKSSYRYVEALSLNPTGGNPVGLVSDDSIQTEDCFKLF